MDTEFSATEIRMQVVTLREWRNAARAAWHRASKRACGLSGELTDAQYERAMARCRALCDEVERLDMQVADRERALTDARTADRERAA